jgi:hypothetical protein
MQIVGNNQESSGVESSAVPAAVVGWLVVLLVVLSRRGGWPDGQMGRCIDASTHPLCWLLLLALLAVTPTDHKEYNDY